MKEIIAADRATIQVARLTGLPRLQIRVCFHCYSLKMG